MTGSTPALVRCEGVDVVLAGRRVLTRVDLAIEPARIHVLLGPNGGGKTTLLRVLLGLVGPERGCVVWRHADGLERPRPFPIGYAPQRSRADLRYPLSVGEVVAMVRRDRGAAAQSAVRAALERLGLDRLARRPIRALSGGEQQRMWIARALALEAPVLLLDEPTTGLDADAQRDLLALVGEQRDRHGVAVVVTTHDPAELLPLADRVVRVAREVQPLDQGSVSRLLSRPTR